MRWRPHLYWLATTGAQPCAYAVDRHLGKLLDASLVEAVVFVAGAAMLLALPAAIWALLARSRLLHFVRDFRAMNSGLWLLFLLGIATIVFPAVTAVLLRSSMMVIWSVQGLFLFVILLVCGASYQIERDRIAGLAAFTVGAALLCAVIVAPAHAVYRNTHPLHEGRNFYAAVAEELTRQWHAQVGTPLQAVGGDDALAFALAFYSPDHPVYERRLVNPLPRPLPRKSNLRKRMGRAVLQRRRILRDGDAEHRGARAPDHQIRDRRAVEPVGSARRQRAVHRLHRAAIVGAAIVRSGAGTSKTWCRRGFQRDTPRPRQRGRKGIGLRAVSCTR